MQKIEGDEVEDFATHSTDDGEHVLLRFVLKGDRVQVFGIPTDKVFDLIETEARSLGEATLKRGDNPDDKFVIAAGNWSVGLDAQGRLVLGFQAGAAKFHFRLDEDSQQEFGQTVKRALQDASKGRPANDQEQR